MSDQIVLIPIDNIKVEKHNVRISGMDVGIEDLAASIKAVGLLQPITAYYDSEKKYHVILAGQRRLHAFHYLSEHNQGGDFDKIKCVVIDEPNTAEKKSSLSLAENITQLPMQNNEIRSAVTELYNKYSDYEIIKREFGLTEYIIKKYVKMARLPEQVKTMINSGGISSDIKKAENASIKAVDALQYTKGGDVDVKDVIELAEEYAKSEIGNEALDKAARKGGDIKDIIKSARNTRLEKQSIDLSIDVAEKLAKIANSNGESKKQRATAYVVKGVQKDYLELED